MPKRDGRTTVVGIRKTLKLSRRAGVLAGIVTVLTLLMAVLMIAAAAVETATTPIRLVQSVASSLFGDGDSPDDEVMAKFRDCLGEDFAERGEEVLGTVDSTVAQADPEVIFGWVLYSLSQQQQQQQQQQQRTTISATTRAPTSSTRRKAARSEDDESANLSFTEFQSRWRSVNIDNSSAVGGDDALIGGEAPPELTEIDPRTDYSIYLPGAEALMIQLASTEAITLTEQQQGSLSEHAAAQCVDN